MRTYTCQGRKFRAHDSGCADGFKTDRRYNLIYPSYNVDGEIMSVEKASIEAEFCAYCNSE